MDDDRSYFISQLTDECRNIWLSTAFLGHVLDVLNSPRIAIDDLRVLVERDFSFFAPDNTLGRVFEWPPAVGRILYLSPKLLELPPSEAKAAIAHELAHVFLQHLEMSLPMGEAAAVARHDEEKADRLAEWWGFKVPDAYRNRL